MTATSRRRRPPLSLHGRLQALRRRPGAHRHRARRPRRRGGRPGRRQRRRQVDPRQDHRRRLHPRRRARSRSTARPVSVSSPAEAQHLGIATVFQDLALCDNLDVVANLFLGRELQHGRRPRRGEMEQRSPGALLRQLSRQDPLGADPGRQPLRRPAPDRRHRPLAARRAQGRHARRADRRARRRPDRRGAQPRRAAARARPRRHPDQPQHGRRHGRRRPGRRAAPRPQQRHLQRQPDHQRRRSSPPSPARRTTPSRSGPRRRGARRSSHERGSHPDADERAAGPTRAAALPADLQDERLIASQRPRRLPCRAFVARLRSGDLGSLPVVVGLVVIWAVFQCQNNAFLSQPQPGQPHPAERGHRHHRPRHRAGAAARRDRPVGRLGQRSGRGHPRRGPPSTTGRWALAAGIVAPSLAGAARRRCSTACSSPGSACRASSSPWPACSASSGCSSRSSARRGRSTSPSTRPREVRPGAASCAPAVAYALVVLVVGRVCRDAGCAPTQRRGAAGLSTTPMVTLVVRAVRCSSLVLVAVVLVLNRDRGVLVRCSCCSWLLVVVMDFVDPPHPLGPLGAAPSAATSRPPVAPASTSAASTSASSSLCSTLRRARRPARGGPPRGGEPEQRWRRRQPQRHRGGGHRRHEPVRWPRHGLLGAARHPGDPVDLQRAQPGQPRLARSRYMITGGVLLLAVIVDSLSRRSRAAHGRA